MGAQVESAQGAPARTLYWLRSPVAPAFRQGADSSQLGGVDAAIAAGNRLATKPRAFGV